MFGRCVRALKRENNSPDRFLADSLKCNIFDTPGDSVTLAEPTRAAHAATRRPDEKRKAYHDSHSNDFARNNQRSKANTRAKAI